MPAIRLEDLNERLQQKLAPIYVIHGDEPLFIQEAGDAIRQAASQAGCVDREVFIVERGFKWVQLATSTQNLSLFGEKKLIDLRIPNGKPDSEGVAFLEQLAANADGSQIVLITLPRLDRATQKSSWFTALDKVAVSVSIATPEREALPGWIAARLARYHLRAVPEALALLAAQCEGNLLAARQEVEKLALLYPADQEERTLSLAEVEEEITNVARFDIFELSEAWLSGDSARALHLLNALREEGEAVTLIVWQYAEDIHALAAVRAATMQGQPLAQALTGVRVWGRRQPAMQKALRRVANNVLPQLLRRLADLDALSKGLKFGKQRDIWEALADNVLLLCQNPTTH